VFLWSRRNQISEQIGNLSDQIAEWRDDFWSGSDDLGSDADAGSQGFIASTRQRGNRKSQSDIAEEALTLKETGKTTA
jgi:hypothetical protein